MIRTQDPVATTAERAEAGVDAGERASHRMLDRLADKAADLRDEGGPVVDRLASQARDMARHSSQWVREGSERLRDQAGRVSDRTTGYVRDEPVRALLMAAATGALLYAVVRLLRGRADR
jgi:ElaB/YqjD/DUF883 family membrane-anchored ribosome-binding protein